MMRRAVIFAFAVASLSVRQLSHAYEPPNYAYSRRIEEAALLAQRAGVTGPYLFGIEVTQPYFGVSLTADDGEFLLSDSPYQQLIVWVLH